MNCKHYNRCGDFKNNIKCPEECGVYKEVEDMSELTKDKECIDCKNI